MYGITNITQHLTKVQINMCCRIYEWSHSSVYIIVITLCMWEKYLQHYILISSTYLIFYLIWCLFDFGIFNATFSNISAISWQPVLVVEEAGVPGENPQPRESNWQTLPLVAASRVHLFCKWQSRARTHGVVVIGLYDLLGNPAT